MSNTELASFTLTLLQGVNIVALFILIAFTLLAIATHAATEGSWIYDAATGKTTPANSGDWDDYAIRGIDRVVHNSRTPANSGNWDDFAVKGIDRVVHNSHTPANSGVWDDYAIRGIDREDNCVVFPVPTKLSLTKDEFASLITEDGEKKYDNDNRMQNQVINILPYLDVKYATVPKANVKLMKVEDVIHL